MYRKPTLYWNERLAMSFLIEAASIHRRLPEVRVQSYQSLWPTTLKDEWEYLYNLINGRTTLGPPMPPEVTFHEEVMDSLIYLDRDRQQIVWARANRIPWKIMTEEFGRCRGTLWRRMNEGLYQIALHFNRIDPKGEHFRRLRFRANGFDEHS